MPTETPDPTLPLLAEIASLKSALATVQEAYTKASLELLIQRSGYQKLGSLVVNTVSASVLSLFNVFVDYNHA